MSSEVGDCKQLPILSFHQCFILFGCRKVSEFALRPARPRTFHVLLRQMEEKCLWRAHMQKYYHSEEIVVIWGIRTYRFRLFVSFVWCISRATQLPHDHGWWVAIRSYYIPFPRYLVPLLHTSKLSDRVDLPCITLWWMSREDPLDVAFALVSRIARSPKQTFFRPVMAPWSHVDLGNVGESRYFFVFLIVALSHGSL